jgi:hypothetical protein
VTTKKNRTEIWLAVIGVAVGLPLAAFLGLWAYVSATPPLHPNPQDVPSVTYSAPLPKWADAGTRGHSALEGTREPGRRLMTQARPAAAPRSYARQKAGHQTGTPEFSRIWP